MRRNAKIIQISGLRGLLFIAFAAVCLTAGFVVFPGFVGMCAWNHFLSANFGLPEINIYQGILLWGIIAFAIYLSGGGISFVQLKRPAQLNEEELQDLMMKIKTRSHASRINSIILNSEKFQNKEKSEASAGSQALSDENKKENL